MGAKVRITLNSKGIGQLLSSDQLQEDAKRRTEAIAQAAGGEPDFEARVQVARGSSKLNRVMGYVTTASAEGRRKQAEELALIRALDAGR